MVHWLIASTSQVAGPCLQGPPTFDCAIILILAPRSDCGPYFFDQWNHKQCWESLQTRPGNLAGGGNEPVHHARSGFLKNVRGLKRAGYRIVWLKHFGLRNPTKKFWDENVWGLECFKRPPNVLGKGNTFLRHFQRKALKFRLIFLEFKSSITHPISQFLGNKFIKYLYSFWNRAKINSKPNF